MGEALDRIALARAVHVRSHKRTSKTGKVFDVQAYIRNLRKMNSGELRDEFQSVWKEKGSSDPDSIEGRQVATRYAAVTREIAARKRAGTYNPEESSGGEIKAGSKVTHPDFGDGEVVSWNPDKGYEIKQGSNTLTGSKFAMGNWKLAEDKAPEKSTKQANITDGNKAPKGTLSEGDRAALDVWQSSIKAHGDLDDAAKALDTDTLKRIREAVDKKGGMSKANDIDSLDYVLGQREEEDKAPEKSTSADKHLSDSDLAKVMGPKGTQIGPETVRAQMDHPSGSRPRIYAYLQSGDGAGQTVKITSHEQMNKYEKDIQAYWASGTTVEDLVQPKKSSPLAKHSDATLKRMSVDGNLRKADQQAAQSELNSRNKKDGPKVSALKAFMDEKPAPKKKAPSWEKTQGITYGKKQSDGSVSVTKNGKEIGSLKNFPGQGWTATGPDGQKVGDPDKPGSTEIFKTKGDAAKGLQDSQNLDPVFPDEKPKSSKELAAKQYQGLKKKLDEKGKLDSVAEANMYLAGIPGRKKPQATITEVAYLLQITPAQAKAKMGGGSKYGKQPDGTNVELVGGKIGKQGGGTWKVTAEGTDAEIRVMGNPFGGFFLSSGKTGDKTFKLGTEKFDNKDAAIARARKDILKSDKKKSLTSAMTKAEFKDKMDKSGLPETKAHTPGSKMDAATKGQINAWMKSRIDWHTNGMMSGPQAPLPKNVKKVHGDVGDGQIRVEMNNGDVFVFEGQGWTTKGAPKLPKLKK